MPCNFSCVTVVWHVQSKNLTKFISCLPTTITTTCFAITALASLLDIDHNIFTPPVIMLTSFSSSCRCWMIGPPSPQLFLNVIGAQHPFPHWQLEPGRRYGITSIASGLLMWAAISSIVYPHSSSFDIAGTTFHADLESLVGQHDHSFTPT